MLSLLPDAAVDEVARSDRLVDLFLDWASASDERLSGLNPPGRPRLVPSEQRRWHARSSRSLVDALTPSPRRVIASTNDVVRIVLESQPKRQPGAREAPAGELLVMQQVARLAARTIVDQAGLVLAGRETSGRNRIRADHHAWLIEHAEVMEGLGVPLADLQLTKDVHGAEPVLTGIARDLRRVMRDQPKQPAAYVHTNSRGVTYYLNRKSVTLRGGKTQTIYFFSRDFRLATAASLPSDRRIEEMAHNGFLLAVPKLRPVRPGRLVSASAALHAAPAFALAEEEPATGVPSTDLFEIARAQGIDKLTPSERTAVAPHVAEAARAVATLILDELGFTIIWQGLKSGPDLLLLGPTEDALLAVEVQGTLRGGARPKARMPLAPKELASEWGIPLRDMYGALMFIDFGASTWRAAITRDFEHFAPVRSSEQLELLDVGG